MQKRSSRNLLQRKDSFDLHFSVTDREKTYNALADPHANYYFASKAAKQRLRELKSDMRREKASPRSKEMIKLIKQKMKVEFPKIRLPFVDGSVDKKEGIRRMSEQFHLKNVTERLKDPVDQGAGNKKYSQKLETETDAKEAGKYRELQKSSSKLKLRKSKDRSKHKINHTDFLKFLAIKKEELEKTQPVQNNQ